MQSDLANSYKMIAADGPSALYGGPVRPGAILRDGSKLVADSSAAAI